MVHSPLVGGDIIVPTLKERMTRLLPDSGGEIFFATGLLANAMAG